VDERIERVCLCVSMIVVDVIASNPSPGLKSFVCQGHPIIL
jgi:hypothetical protein